MKRVLSSVIACGCLALAACQPYTGPTPGLGDPVPAPINDPQIVILEPELQEWLGFQPAQVTYAETGTMRVEVPMRNLAFETYQLDYRFIFMDENDTTIEPTMGWTHKPVYGKQTVRFIGRSLSPEAASYRLEIKWAK